MDALGWLAVAGGTLAGVAAGLVPGLHVNTVCAVVLAAAPHAGPHGAVALAAAGTSHAFASVLPATYLGAPGEETLASALPAHRMLLDGRGPEAVRVSLLATLAGLVAAVPLLLPYKWLLLEPLGLLAWVEARMAWALGGLLAFLALRELRSGWRAAAAAAGLLALSGLLGAVAGRWAVQAAVPVPATPLLPLLSGLFGAPALLEGLRRPAEPPPQRPAPRVLGLGGAVASGVAASAATAILPGLTSSVAVALARAGRRTDDPRLVLATQAAIASAHLVLSFGVLWMTLRARTGLAVAVQALHPLGAWATGPPPAGALAVAQACVAAGLAGAGLTALLDRAAARRVHRLPARALAAAALAATVALVAVLSGPSGLLLFGVAAAVGSLPAAAGLGRLHLTGALLVPALLFRLGWLA